MRVGIGYDIHRLVKKRKLTLGGVNVPHSKGLLGHSDGDALIHAVIDAILGALGHGDIGELFPDNDKKFKDISSVELLNEVMIILSDKGYKVSNVDTIIVTEEPKLGAYKKAIRENLAKILKIRPEEVNVKAKTNEGLGPVGMKKAVSSHCVVMLIKK